MDYRIVDIAWLGPLVVKRIPSISNVRETVQPYSALHPVSVIGNSLFTWPLLGCILPRLEQHGFCGISCHFLQSCLIYSVLMPRSGPETGSQGTHTLIC